VWRDGLAINDRKLFVLDVSADISDDGDACRRL
jgi:hypothetical protein